MFYLKYRPQTLEEIDNSNVRETITKLLASKQSIPHAFLFVGQKGTGKTSVARIVAKALNKSEGEAFSSDIVEMDAASNRGIEEVKNIIKEASYLPMSSAYRIFIIDEAHMITNEAYNALLKTLEEPPSTAIFILATTNLEKVPKTIISRCSVVNFGRAKQDDIVTMLERIAKHEKITLDKDFFALIAQYADYSFRDAAKILEDLVIQKKLTVQEAKEYLGLFGTKNLIEVIQSSQLPQTLAWIQRFSNEGGSIKNLIESSLKDLHALLLFKHGIKPEHEPLKSDLTVKMVTVLIKLLSEAHRDIAYSPIEALPLEIAVADFFGSKQQDAKNQDTKTNK